jgi:hypothetical protein
MSDAEKEFWKVIAVMIIVVLSLLLFVGFQNM